MSAELEGLLIVVAAMLIGVILAVILIKAGLIRWMFGPRWPGGKS